MKPLSLFLNPILDIIGFSDDKTAFIDRFERAIELQAVAGLLDTVEKTERQQIEQVMAEQKGEGLDLDPILKQYFTNEEQTAALEKATQDGITAYLETILIASSKEQRQAILEIIERLNLPLGGESGI